MIAVNNKIFLREFTITDAPQLVRLYRHPQVIKAASGRIWNYDLKVARKFIREKLKQYKRKNLIRNEGETANFAIEKDSQLVGAIGFSLIGHKAEIGYWLGKEYWGQGIMGKVIKAFVPHLKKKYKIDRVEAKIFPFNSASCRVLAKAGFKREALIIRDAKVGKKYFDHILYGKIV